jgi:predicted ribosome quality control (RQC) complex YloA/Tae2 family protein
MRIKLYLNKSVHENASACYELAKEAKKKREGLAKAIEETKKAIVEAKHKQEAPRKAVRVKRGKQWFEKFHWFVTSGGRLAIGGRNAQQNDMVFAKHMEEGDLFFHADIQGGMALILKDGERASEQEMIECAQFTASFSNAWKNANAAVDVYAVKKSQLSKHAHGGYIPVGAFAIAGERKWFRNTRLGVRVGIGTDAESSLICVIPEVSKTRLTSEISLVPSKSGKEKGALAKDISKRLGVHPDELLETLTNGKSKIVGN